MASALPEYTLKELFEKFSKHGDTKADGTRITLTQSDMWMIQAEILVNNKITRTDTGICFNKFKTRTISYADYEKFLIDLAKMKDIDYNEMVTKMVEAGVPGQPTAAQQAAAAAAKKKNIQF